MAENNNNNEGYKMYYLNLDGLSRFWENSKTYINKQYTSLDEKIDTNDDTIRKYVESLTVNNVRVNSTKDKDNGLGVGLSVTIGGDDIALGSSAVGYSGVTVGFAIGSIDWRLNDINEEILGIDSAIGALASATHFRGVYASFEDAKTKIGNSLDYGDVIIIVNKEYIYNADPAAEGYVYNENQWVELGDTTQENQRISALETWVEKNIIPLSAIDDLFEIKGGDSNVTS